MAAPRLMTAETLNALKGWGTNLHAVDYEAKLDPDVAANRVPAGSVVHVDPTSKRFKLGVGTTNYMPMFTFFASDDPVVVNDGGDPATDRGAWVPVSPTGVMMALVAVGAYELVSTNYTAPQDGFHINDPLTSPLEANVNAGKLVKGTIGTETIVGIVSRTVTADGLVDNGYGVDAVAFWPVFLPVYP